MKLLKVNESALRYYKENVEGNEGIPDEIAQAKLTRNVILAFNVSQEEKHKEEGKQLYLYGNLRILTVNDTIVWIENDRKSGDWFYLDRRLKNNLDLLLGIKAYEKKVKREILINKFKQKLSLAF